MFLMRLSENTFSLLVWDGLNSRSGTFLGSSDWLITLSVPSSLLFLTPMGWKLPANRMEMSQKLFLKDISIGSQPQPVTSVPVCPSQKMTGDSIGSEMSLTVPLPAVENVSLVPQLQSVSFIPKKSFFLSAGRAERTLSRALRSFGAVFEEGLLHHCRAAHDSTTRALLQFRCWGYIFYMGL